MGYIKFLYSNTDDTVTWDCSNVYSVSIEDNKFRCKTDIPTAAGKVVSSLIAFDSSVALPEAKKLEKAIARANQNPGSCELFLTDTENNGVRDGGIVPDATASA